MSIYPNLSAEMTRYGVSEKDVAVAVNKDPRTVKNWISGKTAISQRECVTIRDRFFSGMTTDYLFDSKPVSGVVSVTD